MFPVDIQIVGGLKIVGCWHQNQWKFGDEVLKLVGGKLQRKWEDGPKTNGMLAQRGRFGRLDQQ